jgi:guanylate kinase
MDNLLVSISHTTRPQRQGEQNGLNYHFVPVDEFETLIAQDAFLEYAVVFGHYYGTSRQWLEQQLTQGKDVILEIDWQGARQVRLLVPNCVNIFILPPSKQALLKRLQNRAQDNATVITQRMAAASHEINHYQEYDYLVINDDFTIALADLQAIIKAQRLQCDKQANRYADLIAQLLTV